MSYTFIRFMRACQAQGLSRDSLPYKGWGQPYAAYYALIGCFIMTFVGGYTVFLPGNWDVPTFLFSYAMIGVFPVLFVGWKLVKKTRWLKPEEVDLLRDVAEIEEYTRNYVARPPRWVFCFVFRLCLMFGAGDANDWCAQEWSREGFRQGVQLSGPSDAGGNGCGFHRLWRRGVVDLS